MSDIVERLRIIGENNYNAAMATRDAAIAEIERLRGMVYMYQPGEFSPDGMTWQQAARQLADELERLNQPKCKAATDAAGGVA